MKRKNNYKALFQNNGVLTYRLVDKTCVSIESWGVGFRAQRNIIGNRKDEVRVSRKNVGLSFDGPLPIYGRVGFEVGIV